MSVAGCNNGMGRLAMAQRATQKPPETTAHTLKMEITIIIGFGISIGCASAIL